MKHYLEMVKITIYSNEMSNIYNLPPIFHKSRGWEVQNILAETALMALC